MSTDHPTLSDFLEEAAEEQADEADELSVPSRQPAWTPERGENECLNCGKSVPAGIARVYGDNHGNLEVCSACKGTRDGKKYVSDAHAIRVHRTRDSSVRQGGQF